MVPVAVCFKKSKLSECLNDIEFRGHRNDYQVLNDSST